MKKFSENEIFTNTLKVYPKVKIFVNNGNVYYNNTDKSGAELNNFLQPFQYIVEDIMLAESGDILITEPGYILITE